MEELEEAGGGDTQGETEEVATGADLGRAGAGWVGDDGRFGLFA